MKKNIQVLEDQTHKPNMIRIMFDCFMKYLHEHGFFNRENKMTADPERIKTSTEQLWATLVEDGKHDLVKLLNHIENKELGYGSIVVPKGGFSDKAEIHNSVISWLKDHDINIVDVDNEIASLEKSLKG